MKRNSAKFDSCGVPTWIGESCDQHRYLVLSDTRTYRLLMVIYLSIIEMRISATTLNADREETLEDFFRLFMTRGSSMPAWLGLMWIYQGIGKKIGAAARAGRISNDERLSRLLITFIVLTDDDPNDSSVEHFYNMVGEGWGSCSDDDYKESLYRGFIATMLTQARRELVALGKARGIPEVETDEALLSAASYFRDREQ